MSDKLTCQRCGADGKVIAPGFTRYDCLSANDGGKFHQHARCQRIELERLRAIVEPLERLGEAGYVECYRTLGGGPWHVEFEEGRERLGFEGATLAEALAKAEKELEGPKE